MKQIHIDRLLKLADHLEHGQLGHKKFNFGVFNASVNGDHSVKSKCGYMGCAIGECPIAFPEDWAFDERGHPCLLENFGLFRFDEECVSGCEFFGVNNDEFDHLFVPENQYVKIYGGIDLGRDATKEQVAANIRAFVALKLPTLEK